MVPCRGREVSLKPLDSQRELGALSSDGCALCFTEERRKKTHSVGGDECVLGEREKTRAEGGRFARGKKCELRE